MVILVFADYHSPISFRVLANLATTQRDAMKRRWTEEELIERWTLLPDELALANKARSGSNKLGLALLMPS